MVDLSAAMRAAIVAGQDGGLEVRLGLHVHYYFFYRKSAIGSVS